MRQHFGHLDIETAGVGFTDVTSRLVQWLAQVQARNGLCTVMILHTSASLVVQENADPEVRHDLQRFFATLAAEGTGYRHQQEGPDDMPAHIKAALTATSLGLIVTDGAPVLGTWQAVYLMEHRRLPHTRRLALHFIGEG